MAFRIDKDAESILQGTLDMLVLRALQLEPMHGWGITERIEQWSEQVLCVGQGTFAAALVASYVPARKILKQTPGRTLRDI